MKLISQQMRRVTPRLIATALCFLFFSVPFLRADDFSRVERYSVRMFSYGTLTIDTRVGDLNIEGWDNPQLSIKAEKAVIAGSRKKAQKLYDRVQVRIEGRDHDIRLSTLYPKRRPWRPFRGESKLSVNFTIHMPYDANLRLKCVDGDVTVSGIAGQINLNDNYGDVEVDVPRVYRLRTLNAHSWLGYVQSDLHGIPQDNAGFGRTLDFRNPLGSQVIVVRVHMGGVWVYGEQD
ncbi:MAG: hypothetical protein KGM47_09635 [Acidobacteriota bacterium]|nr:hypothetical protein [Acidobacteriota bacterium]